MAYNFEQLTANTAIQSTTYFIDANVWIFVLQQSITPAKPRVAPYINYFYSIVSSTILPSPKIAMTSVLLSEIINTFLRQIAMKDYKKQHGISGYFDFKKQYRQTHHCKDAYEQMLDDILQFEDNLEFMDDRSFGSNYGSFLRSLSSGSDLNDDLYIAMCNEYLQYNTLSIVTDDGDFIHEDMHILSANPSLYSHT